MLPHSCSKMHSQLLLMIAACITLVSGQDMRWINDCKSTSVAENLPVGHVICTAAASYRNSTSGIRYTVEGTEFFRVNQTSGQVSVAKNIDRERNNRVPLGLKAAYTAGTAIEIKDTFNILVLDVNDNDPRFVNAPYSASIRENSSSGTIFFDQIKVLDEDDEEENSTVSISCYPPGISVCLTFLVTQNKISKGNFNASLVLQAGKEVDFEKNPFYLMTLIAINDPPVQRNQTVQIVITVIDEQDEDPYFRESIIQFTLAENLTNYPTVGTIEARDGDGGQNLARPLVIEIENDPFNIFEINGTDNPLPGSNFYRAELKVRSGQVLDREASYGGEYRLTVSVTELNSTTLTKTNAKNSTIVTILVSDANDNRPEFVNGPMYNISVAENLANRSVVPELDIIVRDRDGTPKNSRMTISVLKSTFPGTFTINPTSIVDEGSCNLLVSDATKLDYEQPLYRSHTIELLLRETGTTEAYSATATVHVRVTDVNDHSPKFDGNNTIFQLEASEARPVGWVLIESIRATDRDSGIFGQVTYSLSGSDSDKLAINSTTGSLTLAKPLDYERQKELIATVTATDGGGLSSAAVIYVRVTNFNDKAPFFSLDRYTATIREESTSLIPPLILRTNDSDSTAPIKFTIISGNTADNAFRILNQNFSNLNGELIITRSAGFNFSDTPSDTFGRFVLRVLAEDDGKPPLNSSAIVEISLEDINNNPPIFNPKNYSATIPEIASAGQVIATVRATDADIDIETNKRITYSPQAGSVDKFTINSLTGEVTVAATNSFDINAEGSSYFLQVVARDGGAPVMSDIATVFITVSDSNNKIPVFEQQLYIFEIGEDVSIGTFVGSVKANDADSSANLIYSFDASSVVARNPFSTLITSRAEYDYVTALQLDNNGNITTQATMNRDVVAEIQFIAIVRDSNAEVPSVQTATATVVVQISQKSVRKPIFSPPWSVSNPQILVPLPEELPAGSAVITLAATDPSTREKVTKFRIIPGSNTESAFSLDTTSGLITLVKVLDYENRLSTRLSITIEATSPSNATALCTVIVVIQDRNDNAPIFLSSSYSFMVSEDARYPQEFGMVVARDADSGDFGTVRYSLLGTGSNLFDLDSVLGTIKPAAGVTLDRESVSQYNFLVRATDSPSATSAASQRYTEVPLIITLTDSNDNAPTFTNPSFDVSIFENIPESSVILTLTASDPDAGMNGRVTFSISGGNTRGYFGVNPTTGSLRVLTSLIGKSDGSPYVLTVTASDGGSPMRSNSTQVTVIVRSVSETRGNPVVTFPIEDGVYNVEEEKINGSHILQATARDPDSSGGGLVFSLSGEDSSKFRINESTGWISNAQRLDREAQQSFLLVVSVRDAAGLDTLRPVKFNLRVTDINDNAPKFAGCNEQYNTQPVEVVVPENSANRDISTFAACDADVSPNNAVNYYISCGNEAGHFSIGHTSGVLRISKAADREILSEYLLCLSVNNTLPTVNAVTNYNDSMLQVKVTIQDEDDNGPVFASASRTVYIRSDVEFRSEVAALAVTDPDLPINWKHVYEIMSISFTSRDRSLLAVERSGAFNIDSSAGTVRSQFVDYQTYIGGTFEVTVRVRDSQSRQSLIKLSVNILGDENLLRFVVSRSPIETQRFYAALLANTSSASDLSLSFQKITQHVTTASASDQNQADICFVARDSSGRIISLRDARSQLARERSTALSNIYSEFNIMSIGYCSTYSLYKTSNYLGIEGFWWLFIGMSGLIIVLSVGLMAFVTIMYQRYEKMCYALQYQ